MIDKQFQAAIITDVANRIGTNPAWLDALINFETAGTYDPKIENRLDPEAKGLIQFRDEAAKDLGFSDSADLVNSLPDFESQMYNAVLPYLQMRAKAYGPLTSQHSLYMAVFYPKYIPLPADTLFPANVRAANPGINSPQDYINFVNKRLKTSALRVASKVLPPLIIVGGGIALYLIWKHYRK